ncbi:alpha/beta hydrolase [soil metagenome]
MARGKRWRRYLLAAVAVLVVAYLVVGACLYFQQDQLIFMPKRLPLAQMQERAAALQFEPWMNAQGEQIGWQSEAGDPNNVILVFSGQGANAFSQSGIRVFCSHHSSNWKTFLMEYPGYANREGKPSEASFTAAGVEAVDTLAAVPGRKIWLLGQSLGSGVACATVRERGDKIAGLLLLTPFNSLVATASSYYPLLPISPILRTRFDSDKNLANYPGPVAIFVSGRDTTIPPALSQQLYDGYHGRKRLWLDPESDHDVGSLLRQKWGEIVNWLQGN